MAVSTSTLVFALATAVPFGLAIRDTLCDDARPRDPDRSDPVKLERGEQLARGDDHDSEMDDEALDHGRLQLQAGEATRRADEAAHQAQRSNLRTIFGGEPATLGPALGGAAFDAIGPLATARARLGGLDTGMEIVVTGNTKLHRLTIRPRDGATDGSPCSELKEDLDATWGAGDWVNSALAQRAAWKSSPLACELTLETYAAPEAWIGRARTSVVPLWAVGRPSKELIDQLELRDSVEELDHRTTPNEISWADLGVGPSGRGPTRFTASVDRGRIVAVDANVEIEAGASDLVLERMTKLFGASTAGTTIVWPRSKPALEAELAGGRLYITAGKVPE